MVASRLKVAQRIILMYKRVCYSHQRPRTVYLNSNKMDLLYCVATTHSLKHTYTWKEDTISFSPVLWVNKPSAYRCTVKESDGPSCQECLSTEINLKGVYEYAVISIYHSPHHPLLYLALVHEEEEEDCLMDDLGQMDQPRLPPTTSSCRNPPLQLEWLTWQPQSGSCGSHSRPAGGRRLQGLFSSPL